MQQALDGLPFSDFSAPEEIALRRIDKRTGEITNNENYFEEVFLPGTEPSEQTTELPSIFLKDY